jgi:DNA topoisomerase-1
MSETTPQIYCVKCKTKRDAIETEPVFTKNGTPALKGKCSVCGTTLFRMGATPAHAGMEKPVIEKSEKTPKGSKSPKKGKEN